MPKPTSKSRQELRSRFVRNAIPTETDFADLIAASLNQADDGVLKLPDQPLGLVRQKPDQPVLRFFADAAAEGSVWQVQLGGGDNPGFGLAGADGKLALFVDGKTGNVGIGIGAKRPEAALHIAGILKVEAGNILLDKDRQIFFTDNGQIGSRDKYHQLLFRCTENITELREFGDLWFSAGANGETINKPKMVISASGTVGIGTQDPVRKSKLNILELVGTAASENTGTILLDHEDAGGASSIVFRSKVNRGIDYAFLEFKDLQQFLPRQTTITDWGYKDRIRGWYDIQGQGVRNDYCRWVGDGPNIWFSCALAGSSDQYTPRERVINPDLPHDDYKNKEDALVKTDASLLTIGVHKSGNIYLKSSGGVKIDVLKLGDKWRLSSAGDCWANDDWLRMTNIANTAYYGGFAASKFWTVQGQYTQSDLRSKDNIKNLNSALENLINLQGVSFTWRDNPVTFADNDNESLGLVAQDVKKVFPQLVQSGPDGKLGVNYIGLIPVLVECIKEQQVQIHSLRDQLINHL